MAASSRSSWHNVVTQWKNELVERDCPLLADVSNHISALTSKIDSSFNLGPPSDLATLVFSACFAAIQCSPQGQAKISSITEVLGILNGAVPSFASEFESFPVDTDVQRILRDVFNAYMDSLTSLIDCLKVDYVLHTPEVQARVEVRIQETAANFETLKAKFWASLGPTHRRSSGSWSYDNMSLSEASHYTSQMRFAFHKHLGRGSFGEVQEVRELSTGEAYAMKIINLPVDREDSAPLERNIQAKVDAMKRLSHDHIVKVLIHQKELNSFSFLMLPVADQDLRAYLETCIRDAHPENALSSILPWFGCLLLAFAFAHRNDVIHRDIKPSNILVKHVNSRIQIVLADFGLAKVLRDGNAGVMVDGTVDGTLVYRAPGVSPRHCQGAAADIFSLGCVFSEMLTVYCGRSLRDYQEFRRASTQEEGSQLAFRENLSKVISWGHRLLELRDEDPVENVDGIIRRMLRKEPERRPEATQAI